MNTPTADPGLTEALMGSRCTSCANVAFPVTASCQQCGAQADRSTSSCPVPARCGASRSNGSPRSRRRTSPRRRDSVPSPWATSSSPKASRSRRSSTATDLRRSRDQAAVHLIGHDARAPVRDRPRHRAGERLSDRRLDRRRRALRSSGVSPASPDATMAVPPSAPRCSMPGSPGATSRSRSAAATDPASPTPWSPIWASPGSRSPTSRTAARPAAVHSCPRSTPIALRRRRDRPRGRLRQAPARCVRPAARGLGAPGRLRRSRPDGHHPVLRHQDRALHARARHHRGRPWPGWPRRRTATERSTPTPGAARPMSAARHRRSRHGQRPADALHVLLARARAARPSSSPAPRSPPDSPASPVQLLSVAHRTRRFGIVRGLQPGRSRAPGSRPASAPMPPRPHSSRPASAPADVDVAQLQDTESGAEIMHMAECGFCEHGEQEELIAAGATEIGGRLPDQHRRRMHRQRRADRRLRPAPGPRDRHPAARRGRRPSGAGRSPSSASPTSTARRASAPAPCWPSEPTRVSHDTTDDPRPRRLHRRGPARGCRPSPHRAPTRPGARAPTPWRSSRTGPPSRSASETDRIRAYEQAKFDAGWGALTWPAELRRPRSAAVLRPGLPARRGRVRRPTPHRDVLR